MHFIVESGSTKSDWVQVDSKNNQSFYTTIGFNPYFHSSELITSEIRKNLDIMNVASEIKSVYFYGAGCSSSEMNAIVEQGLKKIFLNAFILVEHDLLACAYATYTGRPVISCIIGTGSNSCLFDGENLSEVVPALGYILGDEGSGSYFGKQLISSFLYHLLPKDIEADFIQTYQLDKESLVNRIYREPNANVFIASFMPFIAKHKDSPFFRKMITDGFKKFMEIHVCCYDDYKNKEVNFVGSISLIFERELNAAGEELGIEIGRIIPKPIHALVQYHLDYVLKKQII
jgi:glucosamine kinase